jgi:hypothetical protein
MMNRNILSLVIGALVLGTVALGYQLYRGDPMKNGVRIGEHSLAVEKR